MTQIMKLKKGIKRATNLLKVCDIQIRVVDGTENNWKTKLIKIPKVNDFTIDLINKSDLKKREITKSSSQINISSKTGKYRCFNSNIKREIN